MKMNENDLECEHQKLKMNATVKRKKKTLFGVNLKRNERKMLMRFRLKITHLRVELNWAMDVKYITARRGAILNILAIYILI